MAYVGGTTAATVAAQHTSSYRVKFDRKTFLEHVQIAKQKIIYFRKGMNFFAYNGFVIHFRTAKSIKLARQIIISNSND